MVRGDLAGGSVTNTCASRTLDSAHLTLITYSVYYYLVLGWGDVGDISKLITPLNCHLILLAFSTLLPQLFFLHRLVSLLAYKGN